MKKPLIATISKFPPYVSGHSFEAMNQGKGLYELTGYKHHEVTYRSSLYDKSANFNDSTHLIEEIKKFVYVHQVEQAEMASPKVLDGHLIKAFTGKIINLVQTKGVNVLSTYYLDPHAYIANQAKLYAEKILGKRIITVHKAVGTDIINSIGNHLKDGQGKFLLLQLLEADLMLAVSQYAKDKIIELAEMILPDEAVDQLTSRIQVLYAPLDNEYLKIRDIEAIKEFKKEFKINPGSKIISYFGRVFPEKGIDDLLKAYKIVRKSYPDIRLVVGGDGVELNNLKNIAARLKLTDIIFTGAILDPRKKRALMQSSLLGVIPTKPTSTFVETLCISALEYQASGCVLLTTKVGGVPEAAGSHSLYARHSDSRDLAKKITMVLDGQINRKEIIKKGLKHVDKFNYLNITRQFLEMVAQKREVKRPVRTGTLPEFWLNPGLVKAYGREY